jgi:hypothetical protein
LCLADFEINKGDTLFLEEWDITKRNTLEEKIEVILYSQNQRPNFLAAGAREEIWFSNYSI